ncbi:MAG: PfkB family carbohydrate kinase [Candidatus Omnitrophica bacterium]|nr:PfkB family carbohydrate kinase [Candidatus Omnitrophota bacterium]
MCGTLPPGIPENFYSILIEKLRKTNKNVFFGIDADYNYLKHGISSNPELIKLNICELERLVSQRIKNLDQLKKIGKSLLNDGISYVIVTMGEKGAVGFYKKDFFYAKGPIIRNPGSVGCGDVFLAGFVLSLSKMKGFKESLRFAVAAATAKAAEQFTDIPGPDKVKKYLKKILVRSLDDIDGRTEISSLQEVPE